MRARVHRERAGQPSAELGAAMDEAIVGGGYRVQNVDRDGGTGWPVAAIASAPATARFCKPSGFAAVTDKSPAEVSRAPSPTAAVART